MITKEDIELAGYNDDYIEIQGEAIMKEGHKNVMDFNYILEKAGKIERFIEDIVRDVKRRERTRHHVHCTRWLETEYRDCETRKEAEEAIESAVRRGGIRDEFDIREVEQ